MNINKKAIIALWLASFFCIPAGCQKLDRAAPVSPLQEAYMEQSKTAQAEPAGGAGLADKAERLSSSSSSPQVLTVRKLIKTGAMTIWVSDLLAARKKIVEGAQKLGGFIAGSSLRRLGDALEAVLTLRVPAERFDDLMDLCRLGGEVADENMNISDVTDQWVDLEARLSNAKRLEARLLEILQTKTGKLSDLLEVERELARVREEIERMDAQRRNLGDQISLSTLTVTIREQAPSKIKAPESVWRPTVRVFKNLHVYAERSMAAVAKAISVLVVAVIYILPWALILGAFAYVVSWARRRRKAARALKK